MDINKNISPDTKEENSFLSSMPGQSNFSVPADYFDYLPQEIIDRIHLESKQKNSRLREELSGSRYFSFLKPSVAFPSLAVLTGIILLLFFFLYKNTSSDELVLSENDIQQIIDNPELYNIDETSITEEYLASAITDETENTETTISIEEIKSYLEENADVTNIINEL